MNQPVPVETLVTTSTLLRVPDFVAGNPRAHIQPEVGRGVSGTPAMPRDRTNDERIARGGIDALVTAPQVSLRIVMTQHPCLVTNFRHVVTNDIAVIRQSINDNGKFEFEHVRLERIEPLPCGPELAARGFEVRATYSTGCRSVSRTPCGCRLRCCRRRCHRSGGVDSVSQLLASV